MPRARRGSKTRSCHSLPSVRLGHVTGAAEGIEATEEGPSEPLIEQVDAQLATIAAERDRIAGELHDDSVQAMTAVSLQLQRLARRVTEAEEVELVERLRSITDSAIDRLRHMLFVLHPTTLEDDGLVVTLEIYFESYVEGHADVAWSVTGDEQADIPLGVSALAFRLTREAISNAVRHAEASRIDVVVTAVDHELVVVIRDDGHGFDAASRVGRPGHLGLGHSEAIAEAALGSLDVRSSPGSGTEVTIRLPMVA